MLRRLKNSSFLPWLCAEDFNEIVSDEEKLKGAIRLARQMLKFRKAIIECNLHEIQSCGSNYTWSRGRGKNAIMEKLDRGMAIDSWFQLFPKAYVKHLAVLGLDHVLLLFNIGSRMQFEKQFKRPFKFENMWVQDVECRKIVEES